MKKIISEIIIPLHDEKDGINASSTVKIRLADLGAGPYLCIEGVNLEPNNDESEHQFYLCNEADIDAFAAICKEMLREAQ